MITDPQATPGATVQLERPRYFPRQLVTAGDLNDDQRYVRQRLGLVNRLLHGCGVICGLDVLPGTPQAGQPAVVVTPGYALGPQGDEIYVPTAQTLVIDCVRDVAGDCHDLHPEPLGEQRVYVVLRFKEDETRPIPALPERCAPQVACEPSRMRAGFELACLDTLPPGCGAIDCEKALLDLARRDAPASATAHTLFDCPPASGEWVVLAALVFDRRRRMTVDYHPRLPVISNQRLLGLLRCLVPERTPAIQGIEPPAGIQGSRIAEAVIFGVGLRDTRRVTFSRSGVQASILLDEAAHLLHGSGVPFAIFSPDGRSIATAGADTSARIWDSATGREERLLAHGGYVYRAAFSPDGRKLATGTWFAIAHVWDIGSGNELARLPHEGGVLSLAFSPGGRYLAVGGYAKDVNLWDLASRSVVARLPNENNVYQIAFSPTGRTMATLSLTTSAFLWNVPDGTVAVRLPHNNVIHQVIFSPDGRFVATASDDGTATVWEAGSGAPVASLSHAPRVYGCAFSADGSRLVTYGPDNSARVWALPGGLLLAQLRHSVQLRSADISPDGRLIATATGDGLARLWDAATGTEVGRMLHTSDVIQVKFSPDGSRIISTSLDGRVRIWRGAASNDTHLRLQLEIASNNVTFSVRAAGVYSYASRPSYGYRRGSGVSARGIGGDLL
jgi:WD40 repeat protein